MLRGGREKANTKLPEPKKTEGRRTAVPASCARSEKRRGEKLKGGKRGLPLREHVHEIPRLTLPRGAIKSVREEGLNLVEPEAVLLLVPKTSKGSVRGGKEISGSQGREVTKKQGRGN